MKKSFLVIGLGRFGLNVVKTLVKLKADVLAVDINEERVRIATQYTNQCLVCDPTKKSVLQEIGVKNIDHAIVGIGNNLQGTILATMNLKDLGVKRITVRIDDNEYENVIERLGATKVIIPEEASAIQLANEVVSDSIIDYYEVKNNYAMVKMIVNDGYIQKPLKELNARNKFKINIVGIIRNDEFILPMADDVIMSNDIIILVGKNKDVTKFERFINS